MGPSSSQAQEELIEELWKSHPEIPRDEVYTTPDFYTPDTTDTESERLPLAIRCEYCGRKCENKRKDLGPINDIVLENQ